MQKTIPSQHLITFSKNDHELHNKANIGKYEKNGLTICVLLDNQGLKLVTKWTEANSKTQGTFNREFSGYKIIEGTSFSRGTI